MKRLAHVHTELVGPHARVGNQLCRDFRDSWDRGRGRIVDA